MSRQAEKEKAERLEYGSHERISPYAVMASYGISAKKSLGQNFLSDLTVVGKIVDAAGVGKDDLVIEIGPGLGVMTAVLAEKAGYVAAVEIDRDLTPVLDHICAIHDNIEIIYGDIMRVNSGEIIDRLRRDHPELTRVRVVANLPYYITTPIIMMFLEQYTDHLDSLTFMVQKEVARRLVSVPGSGEYGAITVSVNYYSDASICFEVPSSCFVPRPGVDSAVVNMSVYKVRPVEPKDRGNMFRLVKAAFSQRRKMLLNSVANASIPGITKERVAEALDAMGLDRQIRGEKLGVAEYAAMSDILFG